MKIVKIADKKSFLARQGIPQNVIDWAFNISPKYCVWLCREFMKAREKYPDIYKDYFYMSSHVNYIIDWANAKHPDIMQYDMQQANEAAHLWHEELKSKQSYSTYKTNNVVYKFSDNWSMVKLTEGDCKAEGELMGHCVGSYCSSVAQGTTHIYSLRDPKNLPHVTIEIDIERHYSSLDSLYNNRKGVMEVVQIQGKQNEDPLPEYKKRIKEWFDNLKQTYNISTDLDATDFRISASDLDEYKDFSNEYGLLINLPGVGGGLLTYSQNIEEIEEICWDEENSRFITNLADDKIDGLINYAMKHNELPELEQGLFYYRTNVEERFENWFEEHVSKYFPHPYPIIENYTTYPQVNEQQIEFQNKEFEGSPIFHQKEYNEALNAHEAAKAEYKQEYESLQFVNIFYRRLRKAKQEMSQKTKNNINMTTKSHIKIFKIAQNTAKEIPRPEIIATYVESLKLYLKDNPNIEEKMTELISKLPVPRQIKKDLSIEECKLVYETVGYLWKKITGQDIIKEVHSQDAPETLTGNYWMIKNGVLLQGVNHFSIIKQNASMFSSLLKLNGFALQQYLVSNPLKLIKYILENGGMRVFIDKNNNAYFQLSEETYGKWGRAKIKSLDFNKKIVKIIDFKAPYNGWKSGVSVIL